MRYLIPILIGAVLGLAAGVVSALAATGLIGGASLAAGAVEADGWHSDWSTGAEAANPYVRARVARHGLLALRREEAVYFTRATDSSGDPLTEACSYEVSGGTMPALWWSVTLYDAASRLPMNEDGALSFDASRAGPATWSFVMSPERPEPGVDWVSSRGAGLFDLTLRLYKPGAQLLASPPDTFEPPSVRRISCDGEAP